MKSFLLGHLHTALGVIGLYDSVIFSNLSSLPSFLHPPLSLPHPSLSLFPPFASPLSLHVHRRYLFARRQDAHRLLLVGVLRGWGLGFARPAPSQQGFAAARVVTCTQSS